jgi:HSP20 family protein
MNQSAPFWDFLASLEQQGNSHPLFSQNRNEENERGQENEDHHEEPAFGPWGLGANFFGGRGMPHRGPPPRNPPPNHEIVPEQDKGKTTEKDNEKNGEEMREGNDNGEGPSGNSGSDNEAWAGDRGRRGHCGGPRRRRACGPGGWGYGGPHHGPHHAGPRHGPHEGPHHGPHEGPHRGPHRGPGGPPGPHYGPRGHGRRGGWGPWGSGGLFDNAGAGFDPATLATHFWNQFTEPTNNTEAANDDHTPDADVFDTESAFFVHISLPGAKKEDVGVNWDAEKSELSVAGVIYRPGDEEFLKTLALNERKTGPFERKIRLGTRASPAHIDTDGITAKLEDGILRVEVPKLDTGYVEIRKVDIE